MKNGHAVMDCLPDFANDITFNPGNQQVNPSTVLTLESGKISSYSHSLKNINLMTSTMLMKPAPTTRDLMNTCRHLMMW